MKGLSVCRICRNATWQGRGTTLFFMSDENEIRRIERLEAETVGAIFRGQKQTVIGLYAKVERLFSRGNGHTRVLIARKFIFPLGQLLEMNAGWGREYLDLFPRQLRNEYLERAYSGQ